MLAVLATGCTGRSIKVDNPVFASAPPRKAMVNRASNAVDAQLASATPALMTDGEIQPVGFSANASMPLTGSSIVAYVNGRPVFLDDVLSGFRQMLEAKTEISAEQRNYIIRERLRKQLPAYIDQEIVLQALNQKVPEDRQQLIRESIEPMFQEVLAKIKQDQNLQTDEQLSQMLAGEGMTINSLRDSFVRVQMINGYISTLANAPQNIDRQELVDYYRSHLQDYTTPEQVRFAEIIVKFDQHGGRKGAEAVMANVVQQLQAGRDFGAVAESFSDALSAEKNGDLGWIEQGALADKELEALLFELPAGQLTKVLVKPERFELYRVISHKQQTTIPFQDVQKDIEKTLLKEKSEQAKTKVTDDLKAKAIIETMFDKA